MSINLPRDSRILLVEDQLIIAMDVEFIVSQHGITTIDTATTAEEALKLMAVSKPDAAILDFQLRKGTSLPIAQELLALNIPFVFTTGYGENLVIPEAFSHVPIVGKPYDTTNLVNALAQAIADNSKLAASDESIATPT